MTKVFTQKKESGFTLIELLVVVVMLAILATVAIPSFNSWFALTRLNGAGRQVFTDLRTAKALAIAKDNDVVVTFDPTTSSYSIYDDVDEDFDTAGVESAEWVKTTYLTLSETTFNALPAADQAKTSVYMLTRAGDQSTRVVMDFLAGNDPDGTAIAEAVTFGSGSAFPVKPKHVIFDATGLASQSGYVFLKPNTATQLDRQRAVSVLTTGRVRLYSHTGVANTWE